MGMVVGNGSPLRVGLSPCFVMGARRRLRVLRKGRSGARTAGRHGPEHSEHAVWSAAEAHAARGPLPRLTTMTARSGLAVLTPQFMPPLKASLESELAQKSRAWPAKFDLNQSRPIDGVAHVGGQRSCIPGLSSNLSSPVFP